MCGHRAPVEGGSLHKRPGRVVDHDNITFAVRGHNSGGDRVLPLGPTEDEPTGFRQGPEATSS